jgi:hypothetical protein
MIAHEIASFNIVSVWRNTDFFYGKVANNVKPQRAAHWNRDQSTCFWRSK